MKRLHRKDLFAWSVFSEKLNIDFNGFLWTRPEGNVIFDPLPLTPHDEQHLASLGGAAWIVLTNSAHLRGAAEIAKKFGCKIAGPAAEKSTFPIACDRWLAQGEALVPGLRTVELEGSKTPGELAFVLEETTLICGDLIRSHRAGSLMLLLAEQGLKDRERAAASVIQLAKEPALQAVLVGDGFCVFRDARPVLDELVAALS